MEAEVEAEVEVEVEKEVCGNAVRCGAAVRDRVVRTVEVKGHRAKFEDDDVESRGQVGEEARQRILRRRRVERRVVDLVPPVRIALVDVLQHPNRKALERSDSWRAPPHEGAVHAVVPHAALIGLVEAAAILRFFATREESQLEAQGENAPVNYAMRAKKDA